MIPISLYVTIELVRVGQVFFMMWDRRMHYRDEHAYVEAHAGQELELVERGAGLHPVRVLATRRAR